MCDVVTSLLNNLNPIKEENQKKVEIQTFTKRQPQRCNRQNSSVKLSKTTMGTKKPGNDIGNSSALIDKLSTIEHHKEL